MEMISDTSQMQLLLTNATMLRSSHMINGRQHNFSFKIVWLQNGTLLGHVTHRQQRKPLDDEGALFYVVAVILIYGLSIVMIIASYIRKNKSDRKLNKYLKEMERLRKREFQMQLLSVTAAGVAGGADGGNGKGRQLGGPTGDAYPGAGNITGAVAAGVPEDSAKGGHKKAYALSLKCLPKQKHKRSRYAFSTDNNKMVLELPATAMFYMTDSDNETSMEGDGFSVLGSLGGGGGWDADSRRSISPKDSNGSYVIDVDSEDTAALSGARRKLAGETLRRDSLASIKGTRVILVQPGDDDGDDSDLDGGRGGGRGGGSGSAEVYLRAQLIVNPADTPEVASAEVVIEKPVKSVRLLLPEPEVMHVEHYKLRISDV